MTLEEETKLRAQVDELLAWKREREHSQLSYPLDVTSMQALNDMFRNLVIERINVRDIFFQATQESPTVEGQMRFFNDRSTQTMRITTTTNPPSGSNFTGSINLTAV